MLWFVKLMKESYLYLKTLCFRVLILTANTFRKREKAGGCSESDDRCTDMGCQPDSAVLSGRGGVPYVNKRKMYMEHGEQLWGETEAAHICLISCEISTVHACPPNQGRRKLTETNPKSAPKHM